MCLILPNGRVEGVTPAGQANDSAMGETGAAATDLDEQAGRTDGARVRLSTAAAPRTNAQSRRTHARHNFCRASRTVSQRHLGCIGDRSKITDTSVTYQ